MSIDVKYIVLLTEGAVDPSNIEPFYSGTNLQNDYQEILGGRIFLDKKNNRYGICDLVYHLAFFDRSVNLERIDYRTSPLLCEVERRIEEYKNRVKDA